jgi:hypothetical protein
VDRLAGRDLALDGVQKPDELLMPVALHATADDLAQEAREALFEEGYHTLACIMSWDDASESGFLNRQTIVDRRIHATMDGARAAAIVSGGFEASSLARASAHS